MNQVRVANTMDLATLEGEGNLILLQVPDTFSKFYD